MQGNMGITYLPLDAWSSSGIAATENGHLLIVRYAYSAPAVVEFTESGKPTGKVIPTGSDVWGEIAIGQNQRIVFGADTAGDVVVARTFPSGALRHTYTNVNLAQPEGVAVDPGD
jgi:hypothetical protein